jgi:hypothetical protein
MRKPPPSFGTWILMVGGCVTLGTNSAAGQGFLSSGSLGGFGASATGSMGTGGARNPSIPYAGSFGGFMPYSVADGSRLAFTDRRTLAPGFSRMAFGFSMTSMSMSMRYADFAQPRGARSGVLGLSGFPGATGMAVGMGPESSSSTRMSVMPPNFGYPFYQPPDVRGAFSIGIGMP